MPATALGAAAIRATLERAGLDPVRIDSVVMGNVIQAGNRMNPARQAAIHGGLPVAVPALTVNRVCGSGTQAVVSARSRRSSACPRTSSMSMAGPSPMAIRSARPARCC
jgi:acetyl-CoA acetyltransferase